MPRNVPSSSVFWYSYVGMYVPTVWLGILGATIASVTLDADPAKMVSAVFGGPVAILVLLLVLHGPIATNILNVYSAALAALSMGINFFFAFLPSSFSMQSMKSMASAIMNSAG